MFVLIDHPVPGNPSTFTIFRDNFAPSFIPAFVYFYHLNYSVKVHQKTIMGRLLIVRVLDILQ